MTARTGHCLCGAVRFTARDVAPKASACHCENCRRWTGSALIEVSVPVADVTWEGEIATHVASAWGERAFCPRCGSGLYYRHTRDDGHAGSYDIPLGLFDDPNGFTLASEIFIDQKPDAYAFAGDRRRLTRAEVVAIYPPIGGATEDQP